VTADPRARCWHCGNPADDRYRGIEGIEERRTGGGANKIIGRTENGRRYCRDCVRKIEHGVPLGQISLL
jgi:hypothetical protein